MRLAAYLRVSTAQQAEEDRFGLPRQRHDVEQFIVRSDDEHVLMAEYVEVASGTNGIAGRVAFPDMLMALRDGDIEGIVLSDITRLSRLLTTQEALLASIWASGGRVFTSDGAEVAQDDPDDPMRTAMRQMSGVFAQLERSMISKRLRDGRKAKARVTPGYAWTFAPAGFEKVDGALVAVADAPIWQAHRRARDLHAQGMTLRAVAEVLTTEGLATPSGKPGTWTPIQVSRLLTKSEPE
jgi:DNA invertase Pin-like site-specific DNA recombinase